MVLTDYGRYTRDSAVVSRYLGDWLPSRPFIHSFLCKRVFVRSVDSRGAPSIILLLFLFILYVLCRPIGLTMGMSGTLLPVMPIFECVFYCNGRFPFLFKSVPPDSLELGCHACIQVRSATPRAHRRPTTTEALTAPRKCGFLLPASLSGRDGAGHLSSSRGCHVLLLRYASEHTLSC